MLAGSLLPEWLSAEDAERLFPTPQQTAGPFYPVPEIAKQTHNDVDLTRKFPKDEIAKGEVVQVGGQILSTTGAPLKGTIVEIWQASTAGRYNHPRDRNPVPLDNKFQFWGRMITGEDGKYAFKTIRPGEYPGRSPHIHYRVIAAGHRELFTQMYFAEFGRKNTADFIYKSLSRQGRNSVTVEFNKAADKVAAGNFDVVMDKT